MPKLFFKKDDPNDQQIYRSTDNQPVDLNTFMSETKQTDPKKVDFNSYTDYMNNSDFANKFSVGSSSLVSSSTALRKADEQKLLDQQQKDLEQEAELKRLTREKAINDIKAGLGNPAAPGAAPTRPDFASQYTDLRGQYGLDALDKEYQALNEEIAKFDAEAQAGVNANSNRLQPKTLKTGREAALDEQNRLDRQVLLQKQSNLADMIQTKQNIVNNIMNLKQSDYSNAVNEYNTKFNQAINVQNQVNNYLDKQQAEDNRVRDDARANLTVLQNMMKESGTSWDNADIETKLNIQREEIKAGLPTGTFAAFAKALPKAKLLATNNGYDGAGNEIVSFIYADENGNPGVVRTVKTGAKKQSTGDGKYSEFELKLIENGNTYDAMEKAMGKDNYVSPETWRKLRRDYAFSKADFDSTFRGYINPMNPQDYEGFEDYTTNFKKD